MVYFLFFNIIFFFFFYRNSNFIYTFFFFSSRRRNTRSLRDWSSDVCSSDLSACHRLVRRQAEPVRDLVVAREAVLYVNDTSNAHRSEERRVGKECRSRWS